MLGSAPVLAPELETVPQPDNQDPSVWIRTGINLLSLYRVKHSFELYNNITTTSPEERTREDTRQTGKAAVSDFLDGYFSGVFGSGKLGTRLDELADKLLGNAGMQALKKTGEISTVDANISLVSDLSAIGLRSLAGLLDMEIPSSLTGKARTAVILPTMMVANSSLAQNPDNIRQGVSWANGLAITSRIEYGVDFVQALRARRRDSEAPSQEETTARNSGLRKVFGSLARFENGEDGTTEDGMLRDLRADRRQEILAFCALAFIAKHRGNEVAARNYLSAAMTATLPSLAKAQVETDGWIVKESAVGGSVVRKVLTGAGMVFNNNREVTDKLSGAAAANNLVTAKGRLEVARKGDEASYYAGRTDDEDFIKAAHAKREALLKMAGVGIVAGAVMAKLLDIEMPFTVPDQADPAQTA
jgi:phosphatidylglycerophosphate synthase